MALAVIALCVFAGFVHVNGADQAITWLAPYDGPSRILVDPTDRVNISWSDDWPHDLMELVSKDKFDSCDFTSATELVAKGTSGGIILTLTPGVHYLGCSVMQHCSDMNQKMIVEVVDHAIAWVVPYTGPGSITVEPTAEVKLSWSGAWPHDVMEFGSKAKFDSCDFTGATELVAKGTSGQIMLSLTQGHTHYLGCSVMQHCSDYNQKIAIQVSGSNSSNVGNVSDASCSTTRSALRAGSLLAMVLGTRGAAPA